MRIFKYISKLGWILLVIAAGLIVFQVWLDLKSPEYMAELTTLIQEQESSMHDVWMNGLWMLLCCLGSLATSALVAVISAKIASDFSATLREKIYDKVMSFSMAEIGAFSTASLITRTTNDITQVQMLITMGLQSLIRAPVLAIWAICKISNASWQWTVATVIAVVIMVAAVVIVICIALPKFRKLQKLTDDVNRVTRENLSGIRVVRAYNAEDYQEQKFDTANEKLSRTNLFTNRTMAFLNPIISMVMNGLSLAIYWIGAFMVNAIDPENSLERITLFSNSLAFTTYGLQVVMAFMMLVMIFIMLPRAMVSIRRLNEVLDTELIIKDGEVTESPITTGDIEFHNVSFSYPDSEGGEHVLSDIDFSVRGGETLALIGATGSGKSSIINLIPRFYDATEGEVIVDGVNVKDYNQHYLRDKIGYISQKSVLFSGDIESNVNYGTNNVTEDGVQEALQVAQASNFVNTNPDGIHAYVAQNGDNFSGGQKQRLSIARGIARKPEILIFDDTFSALDYATDRKLRTALKQYCANTTKIYVSQRIGTIRDCDQILVIDEGRIVGKGTHDELIKNCPVYQEIALSQLSAEEL
ncbi:MAG: ABC transporter ATP-binding protein/permease [Coprobacillus sp.]|nr:ABC transporter ATP-binding protein/permease [Coprobacillus sp.]